VHRNGIVISVSTGGAAPHQHNTTYRISLGAGREQFVIEVLVEPVQRFVFVEGVVELDRRLLVLIGTHQSVLGQRSALDNGRTPPYER